MKDLVIRCKIFSPFQKAYGYSEDEKEIFLSNLAVLSEYISEYRITGYYDNLSPHEFVRSVVFKFPFQFLIQNIESSEDQFIIETQATVENDEINREIYVRVAHHYFVIFLYDLFSIINLSTPGTFQIIGWDFLNFYEFKPPSIHCYFYREGYRIIKDTFDIKVDLSVKKVVNLIKTLYEDHNSLPQTGIQKAINSLLHISIESYEHFSPQTGLLITYALESLIGGGIPISLIVKRIKLALKSKSEKNVNKLIRDIYDWRNKIVHGEYSLPHPEIYDVSEEFNKVYSEYNDIGTKGGGLIVILIQLLIYNESLEFIFKESMQFQKA